ncbi:MAG: type II toxin-antitoxin system RelE/ParE family toxin [Nitrospirae bacterium]|nr:type II toxin-antitoxin system RelE/ParE family toxin [Nitrospirota bacterium]
MAKARIDIVFHPAALEEYLASYGWYYERGMHLAAAFEAEVERSVKFISESPERWPVYREKFRRVLVRRFPYSLIYEIKDRGPVVLAVAHGHRKPGYWRKRAKR